MRLLPLAILSLLACGCAAEQQPQARRDSNRVFQGALRQLKTPAKYTTGYFRLAYPGGDLPPDKGVCTDVVIRALRYAGLDLQKKIHEDMAKNFRAYPRREVRPDANIDHRRVPNQICWMSRYAQALPRDLKADLWKPGDLVYWKLPSGLDHCGVVSDRRGPSRLPMVIHNIWQTAEEDVLGAYSVVAHFRIGFRLLQRGP